MTIIACLRSSDGAAFLVATDSGVTDATGYPATTDKLQSVASPPLAWAFCGDDGVGTDFNSWMKSEGIRASTWSALKDDARRVLAELNGVKREALQRSRAQEHEQDTASVLIVGSVGGLFEALELDSRGGHVFHGHDRDPFFALGSGALHARIAHGIARELQPDLADEQLMRFVMSRAIPIAPHCGFPAPLLWVRATEVERLDGIERRDDVPTPGRRRRVRR